MNTRFIAKFIDALVNESGQAKLEAYKCFSEGEHVRGDAHMSSAMALAQTAVAVRRASDACDQAENALRSN